MTITLPIADSEEAKARAVIRHEISRRRTNIVMNSFIAVLIPSFIGIVCAASDDKSTSNASSVLFSTFATALTGFITSAKLVEKHEAEQRELVANNPKDFFKFANDPILRNDVREEQVRETIKIRTKEHMQRYAYDGYLPEYYSAQLSRMQEAYLRGFKNCTGDYLEGIPTSKLKAILKSGQPIFPPSNHQPIQRIGSNNWGASGKAPLALTA